MVRKKRETETLPKKRYIIGHRHGPRLDPKSAKDLETFVSQQEEAGILRRTSVGRTVVEMTEDQMRELSRNNPQLVIEEDEPLKMFAMPGLPARIPTEGPYTLTIGVKDATEGKPVPDVTVYGIGTGVAYKGVTDAQGQATIQVHESTLTRIIASPLNTYWSRVIPGVNVSTSPTLNIELKPLLVTGAYDWGHRLMDFRTVNTRWTGNDIKVGVIDSGIADQIPDLKPAGGYNTLDGQDTKAWNVDEEGHGTHVGGIIAALNNQIGVLGGAPRAKLYSVKVFPGGYISDLVEAVEWCIQNQMDVISMSLGSDSPSQVLAGALQDAYDRGITCVAAAGNENTTVAYPAAFPTVLGVSAIGRFGTFPEDSAHMLKVSQTIDRRGILFAANFTNFGTEVDVCAPGVAILSTVPTGYAAWDGTSMACPLVSALVTLIIEAYPSIRTGDPQQPELVKSILYSAAVDLGMPPTIQGRGLPMASRALAGAAYQTGAFWSLPQQRYGAV
jgi:subtilisin family serine protease